MSDTSLRETKHADPWRAFRRRGRIVRWFLLTGVIALGAVAWIGSRPGMVLVAIVWFSGAVIAAQWLEEFSCPRCKKLFFRAGLFHNLFASECLHCGLSKWSLPDDTVSGAEPRETPSADSTSNGTRSS